MPRTARVIVPNMPHHIVQRGHNRKAVFIEACDYQYYLDNLKEWKQELGIKVYSYCLMTNHIHLIVEPADEELVVSELMKRLAGRQTRRVNRLEKRSGSLWEGRFKISPIDRDNYLLQCCRYVELNPVKARIVESPEEYTWSSYAARIGSTSAPWLDDDPAYLGLSPIKTIREARYKLFVSTKDDSSSAMIRAAIARNQLTGSPLFVNEIEPRTGLRIEARGRGRPKK
ncbi:MAG: transposase [Gammaproteobacteria bacterium]|nr:transposase [Gammaproteobacteria bacterium]